MKSLKLVRFALGAGMMLATFVGCVDDNKDLYDPTITADNPLDITAPDGFDWSTTNTIRLSVEANDEYNGQYDYIIEVFDNNPIASAAERNQTLLLSTRILKLLFFPKPRQDEVSHCHCI